jgi:hypothetical protein
MPIFLFPILPILGKNIIFKRNETTKALSNEYFFRIGSIAKTKNAKKSLKILS